MQPNDLKQWRKQKGLSQEALSALLGIHVMSVSKWERGLHAIPPYVELALKVIEADQVSR